MNTIDSISIVIPIYNGYEFFDECINSIIKQTYTNWELLLGVNGHGDDDNLIYLLLKGKVRKIKDDRIKIFNFADVKGAPNTINKLISLSKYNWIAHLDIDDKWMEDKLAYQVQFLLNLDKTIDVIGTACKYFDEKIGTPGQPYEFITLNDFANANPIIHSSVLIKKELAHYTTEFICYDYDCWLRNAVNGKVFYNIQLPLVYHRIHKNSFFNARGSQEPSKVRLKYFNIEHV
jgi:glycosyltransferase involved in cell wall biosynthesis